MWSLHTDCEIWLKNWRHENSKWSTSTPVIDFEDRDWSSVSGMIGQDTGPVLFVLQVTRYQHGVHFWWMRQTVEGRNILFCFQRFYQCRLRCDSPMIRWLEKYNQREREKERERKGFFWSMESNMMTELGVLDTSGKEKEQRVHPKNSWKNNRIKPGDIEKTWRKPRF